MQTYKIASSGGCSTAKHHAYLIDMFQLCDKVGNGCFYLDTGCGMSPSSVLLLDRFPGLNYFGVDNVGARVEFLSNWLVEEELMGENVHLLTLNWVTT